MLHYQTLWQFFGTKNKKLWVFHPLVRGTIPVTVEFLVPVWHVGLTGTNRTQEPGLLHSLCCWGNSHHVLAGVIEALVVSCNTKQERKKNWNWDYWGSTLERQEPNAPCYLTGGWNSSTKEWKDMRGSTKRCCCIWTGLWVRSDQRRIKIKKFKQDYNWCRLS